VTAAGHLHRFFETWMRHDSAAMASFYSEDAVMEDPTLAAARRGRDEIERYYAEMFEELEDPVHELLDFAMRDDRIWFEWRFGSGGTRRPVERYHGVSIQTMRDGLVVHDVAFWSPGG
jgi:ketosteroid isomerase-like protein